jgi:hypothetical protein
MISTRSSRLAQSLQHQSKLFHDVITILESNLYVIYAIGFSKAFDTVRHNELLGKCSRMELPDHVYNWLVDFF